MRAGEGYNPAGLFAIALREPLPAIPLIVCFIIRRASISITACVPLAATPLNFPSQRVVLWANAKPAEAVRKFVLTFSRSGFQIERIHFELTGVLGPRSQSMTNCLPASFW
jgi:hypothetical protein